MIHNYFDRQYLELRLQHLGFDTPYEVGPYSQWDRGIFKVKIKASEGATYQAHVWKGQCWVAGGLQATLEYLDTL